MDSKADPAPGGRETRGAQVAHGLRRWSEGRVSVGVLPCPIHGHSEPRFTLAMELRWVLESKINTRFTCGFLGDRTLAAAEIFGVDRD